MKWQGTQDTLVKHLVLAKIGEESPGASGMCDDSEPKDMGQDKDGHPSQGEDKVDKSQDDVETPGVIPKGHGKTVTEQDQVNQPLMGGKWVGLGVVQRAGEICLEVSDSEASHAWVD